MKAILVRGDAGYIGSHACKTLARAGGTPVVIDNFSTGHHWAVKWGPLTEGHLADRHLVRRILEKVPCRRRNALRGGRGRNGGRRIVFSSTCATYGVPPQIPISERSAQAPVNPYGESKCF